MKRRKKDKRRRNDRRYRKLGIEPLEVRCLLASDFGDAPTPYPVTIAEVGAQHTTGGGLTLGTAVDDEADGTHSAGANFDDLNGGTPDDESGVTFGTMMVGQLGATVTVNVQGAVGKLDAWIDFNGDGSWGGPGEQIFNSQNVNVGDNILTFDVSNYAQAGTTYGRFRLSTAGELGVGGQAADGEVEDYQVTILSPAAASGVFGGQNTISTAANSARSVYAADVDGDGDLDILSASAGDDKIAWYENDGSQNFTPHTISTAAGFAFSVTAADVDGDGDLDVLSASAFDDKIAWYENDGSQNFTAHTISTAADSARSVFAADVDGDGDLDVLSASFYDDKIAWYENDGSQNFTAHTISTAANGAYSVFAADVDGDGDLDVLSASFYDHKIAWYENDGSQNFTERTISTVAYNAIGIFAADVDGDGDLDVLSASGFHDKIAWYENDGSQNFTARTISIAADGANSVFAADVDGDGDLDVLSASYGDDKIAWYENDGSQNFTARTISTAANGARSVFAADVDGDGDLDVLSASIPDAKIAWYENFGNDFGDAPAPYPTTLAENGARHLASGPTLGANRDDEADGTHSASADADDTTGSPDDEDGVTFGAIRVGALDASVTVNVQGGTGKLDAWIDFNGDGSWGGPGEQVFDSQNLVIGNNNLTFDVSNYAQAGTTYARFRLSTAGDLGVGGQAANGEVEDYQVTILSPAVATGVFNSQNIISTAADFAQSAFAADIDGDGDTDVLSASANDDKIAWYENDGDQVFTEHTISTAADRPYSVFAADVDGDGDLDVLSASVNDDKIAWYENDGSPANGGWTVDAISTTADAARSVFAADVDGDGDLDVLSASADDDKVAWYENNGSQNFTAHTISTTFLSGPESVFAADVDGDGDTDVLSASSLNDTIEWYENDGSPANGGWTPRTISTAANFAFSVFAADVDGDGDTDVLSASLGDDKIAWYENDGTPSNGGWTEQVISNTADGAIDVFAADVDGDGDLDVLSASGDVIAWYQNDGSPANGGWTVDTISTTVDAASSVFAADVDGDGDLDVLSASAGDDKIAWYENPDGPRDLGDAPAPYPTTLAENGARHAASGPTLGANRDTEADGTHSANADADDTTGVPDDEDGVTFGTIRVGALAASVTVNVQGSAGKLDAWIDFNGDGSWGGPSEQILDSRNVGVGENYLTFYVSNFVQAGTTYARFRLSTAGDLGVDGSAADGEVEDYQVTIANPFAAGGVFAGQNTISTAADGARSVFAKDLDGDGDTDMLSASPSDDKIAWYENDGTENFTAHTISTAADSPLSVFATDVDGDGDIDVLSASRADDKIAWYENDGSENFTAHTINTAADAAASVFAADVDGDGDIDVLSASYLDDKIAWYENNGSESFTPHTISTAADRAYSVFAADVDGDGDLDVLSASVDDDKIAWYENDGTPAIGGWTEHTISTAADGATSVFAADVDGDGDTDVLSASFFDDKIAWYENDGTPVNGGWTVQTITTAADGAFSVFAADVDGDGDTDVLSASGDDSTIAWYKNDGSENFTALTISAAADAARSVFAADVDGDGDLDVLSASATDDKIAWYENQDDFDGVSPSVEDAAPNGGDGNNDGVLDSQQENVTSLPNSNDMQYVTIASPAGTSLGNVAATGNPSPADAPQGVDFSVAFLNFEVQGLTAAAATTVTLFMPPGVTVNTYYKFGPTPDDVTDHWYEFLFDGTTGAEFSDNGHIVTLHFVDGGRGDSDLTADGKIEDPGAPALVADFGDAPAPYPTTLAEDGARHGATGPTLGANSDFEADGVHSTAGNANTDDTTGSPDDEDGVTFTSLLIPGSLATVTVNASATGKLDAWVDFNNDGAWAHPGEQIFTSQTLTTGDNLLSFSVPAGATLGAQTFARFRFSSAGGLSPTGLAADGEVEDHAVEICNTTVTNTNNDGLGSLRVAILCSNGATGVQTISFNIPGAGPHVIMPSTALPTITGPVIIDGTSEPDFAGTPVVEIDGSLAGAATTIDGLKISAGNSTVRGLAITRFGGDGIEITTLGGNTIQGNYVGIGTNGLTDKGNGQSGVRVTNTAGNTIGGATAADGNVISGNATHGVFLFQGGASNNVVRNNRVGTNAAGTAGVGNSSNGVYIVDGPDNQVLDNTIAGNLDNGLVVENGAGAGTASGTIARGNEIGTNSAGTAAVANSGIGLFVINAANTTIGGATAGQGNLISGNGRSGIVIQGSPATGAMILGNNVGLAANGNTDLGNASYGVWLLDVPGATVGGATAGESNIISGNNRNGVVVSGPTASATVVRNNLIGVDVTGLIGRGNTNVGVWLDNSPGATVESNVIANNGKQGVLLSGLTASGNVVRDNLIGTAINGTSPLGNTSFGVWLLDAPNNTIGGASAGNVIAKSSASGVVVTGVNSFGNLIQGNSIGTDAGGTINLGNTQRGIQLLTNAHDNTIGGTTAGAGNTIAFNGGAGVWALIDAGVGNAVLGNSTFSNAGVGIDLGPGGATANDASDPDTGPNLRQNTPVMTVATRLANGDLQITYSVDSSVANAAYPLRVEFFLADVDNQEGLTFLGFHNYAAPGATTVTFTPAIAIAAGQRLVATATDDNDNTSEFSANIVVAAALRAAGGSDGSDDENYGSNENDENNDVCRELASADLAPTINAAIVLLGEQGLTSDQLVLLSNVEFAVADLPDDLLGLAADTTITLDINAAGYGWFIEPTPLAHEEFSLTSNATLLATGDSAASGRMDLLTAVLHELSHLLGHDHTNEIDLDSNFEDLMYAELATGLRKLP